MTRLNLHLSEQQAKRLKALAAKTGLTVAEIVRRAVDAYLAKGK